MALEIPEKERLAQIRACADIGGYDGDFMASRINFLLEQIDRRDAELARLRRVEQDAEDEFLRRVDRALGPEAADEVADALGRLKEPSDAC